jgi:hypothetical protein
MMLTKKIKRSIAYSSVQQTLLSTESYSIAFMKTDNGDGQRQRQRAGVSNVCFQLTVEVTDRLRGFQCIYSL